MTETQPPSFPPARGLRVLVAEDSRVAQKLLVNFLTGQGCTTRVAGNGREALIALEEERFDLVLMDVQMPEMDGLEAAAAVRAREKVTGGHVPIIAVTTLASAEDRRRCRGAGMDDHVAKPVRTNKLLEAMARLVPGGRGSAPKDSPASALEVVLDRVAVLERVDGNRRLLRKLVKVFFEDCPLLLEEIRAAIREGNGPGLRFAAHTLRGALGNLSALRADRVAGQLEALGRSGDLAKAPAALAEVEEALRELGPVLAELAQPEGAAGPNPIPTECLLTGPVTNLP